MLHNDDILRDMDSAISDLQRWRELRQNELNSELNALDLDHNRPEFNGAGDTSLYSVSVMDNVEEIMAAKPSQYHRANQEKVNIIVVSLRAIFYYLK